MSLVLRNLYAFIAMMLMALSGAVQAQDETALIQSRLEIREAAHDALATLYEFQPGARYAVERAAGYAVFSTFGIKLLFAGGRQGRGVVVNNRTSRETFMRMVGVQAGLGFGVARTRLIFVFETNSALQSFINQGWEFGAAGSLAAAAGGEGGMFNGAVSVAPGVFVFQITDTGLAAQITATGTRFFKDTALN
jgi:lipid-binding SYLF domain-containing protein